MGLSGISKSAVSKLCKDIDERVGEVLNRPLTGEWPHVRLDPAHAGETWRTVPEQLRPRWPKPADLMDTSAHDVLAYMGLRPFLPQTVHRTVCRLPRTGANSRASIAPGCIRRTRSNA